VAACALLVPFALATAQDGIDEFSNSDLDGGWVGTITAGKTRIPFQLNVNVDGSGGSGFLVLRDPADPDATGVAVFPVDLTKVAGSKLTFRIDDSSPLRTGTAAASFRFGTATFKLSYKGGNDTLSGKASGSIKGKVAATRMSPDLPMSRLWQGSFKIDGVTLDVRIASTEDDEGALGGHASFDDETATLTGTRTGSTVNMTFDLGGQEIVFSGKLKSKNSALQGSFESEGESGKSKLVPGDGKGKPFSFKSVQRLAAETPAGEPTTLRLTGKNMAPGAVAFSNASDVPVTGVEFRSSKEIRVTFEPGTDVADGTVVDVRVLNGDGSVADRRNAFTVTNGGGENLVSFAAEIQPIFTANCASAGCHSSSSNKGSLTLESGSALANIVSVPSSQQPGFLRVQPDNADDSYLARKIAGGPAITGGRMPPNRTPLGQSEIDLIRLWITQGANSSPVPDHR